MTTVSRARFAGSYYDSSSCRYPDIPTLDSDLDIDVAIVGGGITGLSTALQLADRGISSAVFESETFAFGASGRSGGQLLVGFNESTADLSRLVGSQAADQLWQLSIDALALTRDYIGRYQIDCDLQRGALTLATHHPKQRQALIQNQRALEAKGIATQLLEGAALRDAIDSPQYSLGLMESTSGHLHPKNYCLGLARAALSRGVQLFDHSPIDHVQTGDSMRLTRGPHRIRAQRVVLAGNAYIGNLVPELARPILPVTSHIIATEPLTTPLIACQAACSDLAFLLHYFRMSNDGRLLLGGRPGVWGRNEAMSTDILHQRMCQLFPQLAQTAIDYSWGGKVAVTQPQMPDIRRLSPNLWAAQGYSGHGMALAGLAGQVIAGAVDGDNQAIALFERVRHQQFPTHPAIRSGLAQWGMLWYRIRELTGL